MTSQDVQNFINKWMGKWNNYDGKYGNQCKDLFSQYNNDLVKAPYIVGNPIVMWNYPSPTLLKYYTKIPNSLTFIPKLGDVVIFKTGVTGHIGIQSSTANFFWTTVFEQNDPIGSKCHYKAYNYITPKLLGVFRPKSLV